MFGLRTSASTRDVQSTATAEAPDDALLQEWVAAEQDPNLLLLPYGDGADMVITHANGAALDLLDLGPADLGAVSLGTVMPATVCESLPRTCLRVWRTGRPANQIDVLWAYPPLAGPHWVDLRVRRLQCRVALLILDATDRHRQQETYAEGEARYRELAERAADLVFRTQGPDRFAWVSPSLWSLLGYTPADVMGRELTDFLHPADIRDLTRQGAEETVRLHARVRHAAGHWVPLSFVMRAEYDEDGVRRGRIGSAHDLSGLSLAWDA